MNNFQQKQTLPKGVMCATAKIIDFRKKKMCTEKEKKKRDVND